MKKVWVLSLLFLLVWGGIFPQGSTTIDWGMAVLKYNGFDYDSHSSHMPIPMETGDEYYLYVTSDSPGHAYIIKEYPDRTLSILFGGPITAGNALFIMDGNDDFIVPAGSGIIRIHVVVTSTPRPVLQQNQGARLSGAQRTAVIDEIQAIGRSVSSIAEAPELPVRMGAGTRGGGMTVYRYGGQNTYVREVVIRF